jgi:hypothetical protein
MQYHRGITQTKQHPPRSKNDDNSTSKQINFEDIFKSNLNHRPTTVRTNPTSEMPSKDQPLFIPGLASLRNSLLEWLGWRQPSPTPSVPDRFRDLKDSGCGSEAPQRTCFTLTQPLFLLIYRCTTPSWYHVQSRPPVASTCWWQLRRLRPLSPPAEQFRYTT